MSGGREWPVEKRQTVARGSFQGSTSCPISFNRSEAESEQRKRGREGPMEEWQRVANGRESESDQRKEAESGQWKRGRE